MDKFLPEEFFKIHVRHFPMVTVDIVLLGDSAKFLLVKRNQNNFAWKGKWATPGGRIFRNEPIAAAAHRILLREIGISIAPKNFLVCGVHELIGRKEHGITVVCRASTTVRELKLDSTSSSAKWCDLLSVPKSLKPEYKRILEIGGLEVR